MMKTRATYPNQFRQSSGKTSEEIRRACEKIESTGNKDYIVKHNGKHIWIEMGQKKQEVWSPLLHLEVDEKSDTTYVKGQYVENPMLWVALLSARIVIFTLFFLSAASLAFKWYSHQLFGTELMIMFAMASMWFGIYLLVKWNRRLSSKQAEELHELMNDIVA